MRPWLALRDWYEGGKSNHPDKRSLSYLPTPKLHFTLNHYSRIETRASDVRERQNREKSRPLAQKMSVE